MGKPHLIISHATLHRDPNAELLVKTAIPADQDEDSEPKKLSKGEQRKLKQIARQQESKAQRAQVRPISNL